MSKHIIKGYVTYTESRYNAKLQVSFHTYKPDTKIWPGMVIVGEQSIEVEVPDDFDPRPELIRSLQERQTKARADFEKLCTDIQRQISELQALEFTA
jgi:hypothetical protein